MRLLFILFFLIKGISFLEVNNEAKSLKSEILNLLELSEKQFVNFLNNSMPELEYKSKIFIDGIKKKKKVILEETIFNKNQQIEVYYCASLKDKGVIGGATINKIILIEQSLKGNLGVLYHEIAHIIFNDNCEKLIIKRIIDQYSTRFKPSICLECNTLYKKLIICCEKRADLFVKEYYPQYTHELILFLKSLKKDDQYHPSRKERISYLMS